MANSKSALKRIKINQRNKLENKYYKGSVKSLFKLFLNNLQEFDKLEIKGQKEKTELYNLRNLLYSKIDKATKKKVFHKNTAARKKTQISKFLKTI